MWSLKEELNRVIFGYVFLTREEAERKCKIVQKCYPHLNIVIKPPVMESISC